LQLSDGADNLGIVFFASKEPVLRFPDFGKQFPDGPETLKEPVLRFLERDFGFPNGCEMLDLCFLTQSGWVLD
jgi:hypothetical protein